MLQTSKKGFTLIELLVVITIIGILATGAVTTFTSQIQKARDTTRINDLKALQWGIEQAYQDEWQYPGRWTLFSSWVVDYTPKLPQDPKMWLARSNSAFEYLYNVSADSNGIARQEYEVSITFEQNGNIDNKAAEDYGDDPVRYEAGINLDNADHSTLRTASVSTSTISGRCVGATGAASTTCASDRSTLIRTN